MMGRPFFGWQVVGASMLAMSAGTGPFAMASFGIFMLSFQQEFGWDRGQLSWCLTLLNAASAISLIFVGRMVDRRGARSVLLPSIGLMALCLIAIPLLVTEIWHLWLIFLLMGVVGAATNSVTYVPVLSAWFNKRRGLALGLAMSGIGIGYSYVPLLVQEIVATFNWRVAYYCLAGLLLLVALPLVYLRIIEKPSDRGLEQDGRARGEGAPAVVGLTTSEALRTREFWVLTSVFALMTTVMYGLFTHLVPMLSDRGVSPGTAAMVASAMGLATFGGRVAIGFIIDEVFAPFVTFSIVAIAAVGIVLLDIEATGALMFGAAILIGITIGAEADLLAYLSSRYFGTRSLGTVFGMQVAAYMGGVALGPVLFGTAYEASGSYDLILKICLGVLVVILALTALLRAYPVWSELSTPAQPLPAQA